MQSSNYHITVYPTGKTFPKWLVRAHISSEFRDFARKQKIDRKRYEKFGLEAIQSSFNNFKKKNIEYFMGRKICEFDRGLLVRIQVPGDRAILGMNFYWGDKNKKDPSYFGHNFDNSSQVTASLSVLTAYLNEIDYKIKAKTDLH